MLRVGRFDDEIMSEYMGIGIGQFMGSCWTALDLLVLCWAENWSFCCVAVTGSRQRLCVY